MSSIILALVVLGFGVIIAGVVACAIESEDELRAEHREQEREVRDSARGDAEAAAAEECL